MVNYTEPELDVLAIGAHPDDVELGCGALLAKLSGQGKKVGILDLTRGELGSRGDANQRDREAARAAKILGICWRSNVGLPDGGLENTPEFQRVLIPYIRQTRPKCIVTLMAPDRHPDHSAVHELARNANFLAGLTKIETGQDAHRARQLYFFYPYLEHETMPSVVVDVTEGFAQKLESLRAYESQFYNPDYEGPTTYIASKGFWTGIEARAAYWGARIGKTYGEGFYVDGPMPLDNLPIP
ncbi:MAG: bacillithiol biosynthesis deacetylase BshB1 [Candidatus Hydrogenedentales bacterium]|jgi:bacillithiol biosynthesis deacetylase BshB1